MYRCDFWKVEDLFDLFLTAYTSLGSIVALARPIAKRGRLVTRVVDFLKVSSWSFGKCLAIA